MPIRPFPHPLSIGTDIASIGRIKTIISTGSYEKNLTLLTRRILTRPERVQFWRRYGTYDLQTTRGLWAVSQFLTGRFAAKEATIKAVLWRKLSFHDVIIRTPVFGEQMSAVILDRPLAEGPPIQHEVELLRRAEAAGELEQPKGDALGGVGGDSSTANRDERTTEDVPERFVSFGQAKAGPAQDVAASSRRDVGSGGPEVDINTEQTSLDPEEDADDDMDLSGSIAKISISHDGSFATAVCLAAEEPFKGDVGGEAAARGFTTGSGPN